MTTRDALRAALDAEVPAFLDMIMGSAVLDKLTDAILGDLEAASGTTEPSGWWVPATQGLTTGEDEWGRRLYVYTTDQPHPMMNDESRFCCAIGCKSDAEFEVLTLNGGPDPYSDSTDACETHVGALLGYQPSAPHPENVYWEVHALAETPGEPR